MNFATLSSWANEELKSLIKVLPADVKAAALKLPVSMEEKPGRGAFDDELEGDELGLFEGPSAEEETDPAEMPRIRLFLTTSPLPQLHCPTTSAPHPCASRRTGRGTSGTHHPQSPCSQLPPRP